MRLIATVKTESTRAAKVYRDTEWDEYRVKFYYLKDNGKLDYVPNADYHTTDKEDALDTAYNACKPVN